MSRRQKVVFVKLDGQQIRCNLPTDLPWPDLKQNVRTRPRGAYASLRAIEIRHEQNASRLHRTWHVAHDGT